MKDMRKFWFVIPDDELFVTDDFKLMFDWNKLDRSFIMMLIKSHQKCLILNFVGNIQVFSTGN